MLMSSVVLAATISSATGQSFDYIRLGDIDGFGYVTGTSPCVGEPCWNFNGPWASDCVPGALENSAGAPINVDGASVLTAGDYLPDLDCDTGYTYNSDEFDNRTTAETSGPAQGDYTEVSGAADLGSSGSGWTDVAVSGVGWGWDSCNLVPSTGYVCGSGQPNFIFDFEVTAADPTQPLFLNFVFGDYDQTNPSDGVMITSPTGSSTLLTLTVDAIGDDGKIQMATAVVPFAEVFSGWPASKAGYLAAQFVMPDEPMLAFDYAELSALPLYPPGCCCYPDVQNYWHYDIMPEADCLAVGGIYMGDGVACPTSGPDWGGCCLEQADGSIDCEMTFDCKCAELGGEFHALTDCSEVVCVSEGCCCYQDPSDGSWNLDLMEEADCVTLPMSMFYGAGSECGEGIAQEGACCIGMISCEIMLQCECNAQMGVFFPALTCSDVDGICGIPEINGACCYLDSSTLMADCVHATESECLESGYIFPVWHGGLTCSSLLICERPLGACCFHGNCLLTREEVCDDIGGNWHESTPCSMVICPVSCPADFDFDGFVTVDDLMELIGSWGPCSP